MNSSRFYVDNKTALDFLNREKAAIFTSVIIYLVILITIGIVGNTLVFYIYCFKFKKTSANYFIAWLSVLDLISCFLGIPFEIYDLYNPYKFEIEFACKIMRFSSSATVMASGLTLVAVAFDRYYKIGQPLKRFPTKTAKILNVCSVCLGAIFSIPALFVFGRKTIKIQDKRFGVIMGFECSVDDEIDRILPTIYYIFLAILFIFCTACFIVLYGKLGHTLITRKKSIIGDSYDEQKQPIRKESDSDGIGKLSSFMMEKNGSGHNSLRREQEKPKDHENNSDYSSKHSCSLRESPESCVQNSLTNSVSSKEKQQIKKPVFIQILNSKSNSENKNKVCHFKKHSNKGTYNVQRSSSKVKTTLDRKRLGSKTGSISIRTGRVTSIFICISIVFVVSFLPYVIVKILSKAIKNFYFFPNNAAEIAYNFAARSYFINSAANPIIYSFLNETFRAQIKALLKRLTRACSP